MAKCPVCESEYLENQVKFCTTCGWDLTPYPLSLGKIPQAFLDKERAKINWAQTIWKKYQDNLSQSSLKLQQANDTISELKSQLEQTKQINQAEYQSQLDNIYSQLQIATEERTQIKLELNQVNQKLSQIQLVHQESIQTTSPIKTEEDVELKSAVGMDYTNLKNYLERGKLEEADQETRWVMLVVAKRENEGYLDRKSIDNFPCEDLRTIDELWVKYSDGKFGFSVQKRIYQSLDNERIWETFGHKVGWKKGGYWLRYKDITFEKTAPEGHLPISTLIAPMKHPSDPYRFNIILFGHSVVYNPFFDNQVYSLASRLVNCNI